jgi:hypothetical protein
VLFFCFGPDDLQQVEERRCVLLLLVVLMDLSKNAEEIGRSPEGLLLYQV